MVGPQIILGIKSFWAKAMGFSPAKIGRLATLHEFMNPIESMSKRQTTNNTHHLPTPDNSGEQNSP